MRIDVAKEMAVCVKKIGGIVLDDALPQARSFANADYWFPEHGVVAELKSLTEDLSSDRSFNDRVRSLRDSWVRKGLVPAPTSARTRYNLQSLPQECTMEYLGLIKRRLEASTIRKANRQLRETKAHFGPPESAGLLLLLNDGNRLLPPAVMFNLLVHLLKEKRPDIESVIYFSVNETFTVPNTDRPMLLWASLVVPDRKPVSSAFMAMLQSAWMSHHSTLVREPILEVAGERSIQFVDGIQFA